MDYLVLLDEYEPKLMYNGQIRMMCPFRENHEGKRAIVSGDGSKSMFLTPEINAYHCFSCKEHGSLSQLLIMKFDVPFWEAVQMVSFDNSPTKRRKKSTFELDISWDIEPPKRFLKRGIPSEILLKHKVGTITTGKKRGTICIPLFEGGRLIGVKYRVDFPERYFYYSEGFERENYIYGWREGMPEIIVVEGETDYFNLDNWQLPGGATFGVEVGDGQIEKLRKIPLVYLAMDNDGPGINSMYELHKDLKNHTEVRFINYPAADPGVCRRRQFINAYKNWCNFAEFKYYTS